MATRSVRLDADAEQALQEIRAATGLPISEALKRGLSSFRDRLRSDTGRTPFDVYEQLDLGPGGYAIAASTDTRQGVRQALKKKLRR